MLNQQLPNKHHHTRFYLVMITLIIGGVFVLLFLNNDGNGFSLTNAIIRNTNNFTEDITAFNYDEIFNAKSGDLRITSDPTLAKSDKNIVFSLKFDKYPKIDQEVQIGNLELNFNDLVTQITINDNKLELNNLQDINLLMNNFNGKLSFEGHKLSLSGAAKRIEVNGVAFSSEEEIKISFTELGYKSFTLIKASINSLELDEGNGDLIVGNKLEYSLAGDAVKLLYFEGLLDMNQESGFLTLDGSTRALGVSGDLNFNLK